jgi:hypothetical protein
MLRILGSHCHLCDGITRREMLRAGGLSLYGLSLTDFYRLQADTPAPSPRPLSSGFGQAKACILLYLYGAPSQLEVFDLKPNAPVEIRGEFKPAVTSVPGLSICEHLPRTARVMHLTTLIRSMTHPFDIHSAAYSLTGTPTTDIPMELNPHDGRHWPFFGSVLDYLRIKSGRPLRRDIPYCVGLPFQFSSFSPFKRGGPYGGFLGSGFNPVWSEFIGPAPKGDPYRGITPQGRFQLGQPGVPDLTLDRLSRRRSILQQLDRQQSLVARNGRGFDRQQQMAFDLVTSPRIRQALDVKREPVPLRERYGMTLFGQAVLAARRLIENGVPLATVFWDEYGEANSAWDTHVQQYSRLKDELLPGFDLAYSALLSDLVDRGLFDDTLVVCMSEHGRTPKLNNAKGGGRDHWSGVYSGLFAGGGVRRGTVIGASDKIAAYPREHPVSPKDVLCTIYHLLGVDPKQQIQTRDGRPVLLVPEGEVIHSMVG